MFLINALLLAASASAANPELADPTVFRDTDGTFYLYGTSPDSDEGFRCYTSPDLRDWSRLPQLALTPGRTAFGTKWFWAPQVFRHNGEYLMFYTANERIAYAKAQSPAGPFTGGGVIESDFNQIDPYVFFDADGTPYLYFVRLDGGNHIYCARLNDSLTAIDPSTATHCITSDQPWEATDPGCCPIAEGPTVILHDGVYHLFYSSNHFMNPDYAVGHATAASPLGPWKKSAHPVISRHTVNATGTGHGDIVTDADGGLHYVFHTHNSASEVRPRLTWIVDLDRNLTPVNNTARTLEVK